MQTKASIPHLLESRKVRLIRDDKFRITGLLFSEEVIMLFNKDGVPSNQLTQKSLNKLTKDFPQPEKWQSAHYVTIGDFESIYGTQYTQLFNEKLSFNAISARTLKALDFEPKETWVHKPSMDDDANWVEARTGMPNTGRNL